MGWSPRLYAVACLLVVSLPVAAAPASGAPPPRPLCDACGDSFETTAQGQGVSVAVERSTATVTVARNGTATWTVRNRLASGADRLRENATLRRAIADRAMWDTELLGATVTDGGVVVLRYREPEFAEPTAGGALRSGAFTEAYGYRSLQGLGADRLTVHAPPGTRIDRGVPGAAVAENGTRMTLTGLDRQGIVTFVPADSAVGPLLSLLALASLVGPVAVGNAVVLLGGPALLAAVAVSVADYGFDRVGSERVTRLAPGERGLAAVGGLLAVVSLGAAVLGAGGPATVGVGIGVTVAALGTALTRRGVRAGVSYRRLCLVAGLCVGAATAVAFGATVLTRGSGLTWSATGTLPVLGPLFALLPAGYALGRGWTDRAVLTAVAGVVLALVPAVPLFVPVAGLGWLVAPFVVGATAAGLALGVPLLAVGTALGRADDASGRR